MTANLLKAYTAAQASIITVRGLVQTRQKLLKTQDLSYSFRRKDEEAQGFWKTSVSDEREKNIAGTKNGLKMGKVTGDERKKIREKSLKEGREEVGNEEVRK